MASYHHHSDRSARRPSSRPRSLYTGQGGPGSSYLSSYSSGSSPHLASSAYSPSSYSPYSSPSSYSSYGGTSSGYGGLVLPSSSTYNLSSSPKQSSYLTSLLQSKQYAARTSSPTQYAGQSPTYSRPSSSRSNSFNRHHSSPSSHFSSTLSSRSSSALSLKSDASEGYASGNDKSGRSSRLSSSTDGEATSNGEIDYKKLYEESQVENERLREKLRKTEEDLKESKAQSDKTSSPSKNSMSEMEKRERRAMERKLSEMEEELKQLQKLKAENERLRAENRALTRVVSKLTASANAGK